MQTGTDFVESSSFRRRVADEDQRRESREWFQFPGEFGLAVFTGRVERCGVGVAQSADVISTPLRMPLVEVIQIELLAESRNIRCGFRGCRA